MNKNRIRGLRDQLSNLLSLKDGWDSYDAPVPAKKSISDARHVIGVLRGEQLLPETVAPSAEGGVSVYFSEGHQKAFIEFLNEGNVLLARYGKDDEPHVEVLRNGSSRPQPSGSSGNPEPSRSVRLSFLAQGTTMVARYDK